MIRRLATVVAVALALGACQGSDTARQVEELKAQVSRDQEMLRVDAETRDPSRTNLKATFMDTSVMSMRPTSNPDRPTVAYVRIKWHFDYKDGRNLGDAVFDYIYARTADGRWIKADEADLAPEDRGKGGGSAPHDDAVPPLSSDSSKAPA